MTMATAWCVSRAWTSGLATFNIWAVQLRAGTHTAGSVAHSPETAATSLTKHDKQTTIRLSPLCSPLRRPSALHRGQSGCHVCANRSGTTERRAVLQQPLWSTTCCVNHSLVADVTQPANVCMCCGSRSASALVRQPHRLSRER